jgi:hypothetical protein
LESLPAGIWFYSFGFCSLVPPSFIRPLLAAFPFGFANDITDSLLEVKSEDVVAANSFLPLAAFFFAAAASSLLAAAFGFALFLYL